MHTTTIQPPGGKMDYLSFQLAGLDYGIEFGKVKALSSLAALERFADAGAIVKGVASSGGVIMPLVDMRAAFGAAAPGSGETDVIVLQLPCCVVGMVVDGVTEVVRLRPDQISALPFPAAGESDYLIGIARTEQRRLILLDIERLMSIRKDAAPEQAVA